MADTKISALTAVVTPALTDEFPVNQGGASKKITLEQVSGFQVVRISGTSGAAGVQRTTLCLAADSSANTTTTQATVMTMTGVGAGTWRVKGVLVYQTAATTTGIGIVLNHTGTVTRFVSN